MLISVPAISVPAILTLADPMTVEINSPAAARIARYFNDLISPKGLLRIRRKAVNEIGSRIRKQTRVVGPEVIGTSAAALEIRGKAASPGSTDPAYKLRMASKIPIARLKAANRKVKRQAVASRCRSPSPAAKRSCSGLFIAREKVSGCYRLVRCPRDQSAAST